MKFVNPAMPMLGESLDGFFVRLAELNYYESPRWICWLAGFSTSNSVINVNLYPRNVEELLPLSRVTGASAYELFAMTFFPDERIKDAVCLDWDASVPIYAVHKTSSKVCPACLAKTGFIKKKWGISLVTVCTEHRCLLLDKCPQCGSKISVFRKSIIKCACGLDFRDVKTPLINEAELKIARQIDRYMETKLFIKGVTCNSIEEMELYNFTRLMYFTVGQFARICDTTGKFTAQAFENEEMHSKLVKAYNVYSDWPANFRKFLDWKQKHPSSSLGDTGIVRDFGSFYRGLFESFDDPEFDFIKQEFKDYLEQSWVGGHVNRLKHVELQGSCRKYVTRAEAIKQLGVRDSSIDRYMRTGQLKGIRRKSGSRSLVLIETKSVQDLKQEIKKGLSLKEAGFFLGIGHESVVDLVIGGHLKSLKCPADGYATWLIDLGSVMDLLKKINSKVSGSSPVETVSFSKAVRMLSSQGFSIGNLIAMIVGGLIKVCSITSERGLQGFRFDRINVESLIHQRVNEKKHNLMTLEEVANRLHIKYEVLSQWADRGFVMVEKQKDDRKRRRYISEEGMLDFQKKYVLSSALAKSYGVSSSRLIQILGKQGIYPVSGPTIDRARQYLFRVKDISNPLF